MDSKTITLNEYDQKFIDICDMKKWHALQKLVDSSLTNILKPYSLGIDVKKFIKKCKSSASELMLVVIKEIEEMKGKWLSEESWAMNAIYCGGTHRVQFCPEFDSSNMIHDRYLPEDYEDEIRGIVAHHMFMWYYGYKIVIGKVVKLTDENRNDYPIPEEYQCFKSGE